jgi:hypothetical protein
MLREVELLQMPAFPLLDPESPRNEFYRKDPLHIQVPLLTGREVYRPKVRWFRRERLISWSSVSSAYRFNKPGADPLTPQK